MTLRTKSSIDPNANLIKILKKWGLEDIQREVIGWLDNEPGSASALQKWFIASFYTVPGDDDAYTDYWDIDLDDESTWGKPMRDMPEREFFVELYKAIKSDEKRMAKRSSYEF